MLTRVEGTPGSEYQVSTPLSMRMQSAAACARLASPLGSKRPPEPLSSPVFQSFSTASRAQEETASRSEGVVVMSAPVSSSTPNSSR